MDELTKKRIRNIIKQLEKSGKKVINTKYLPTFINQDDFKLSQMEIEDYLQKEDYISISDDYMVYRPDFIKYCIVNNLNTVSKLKKNIFVDHSVPYITLSENELQDILQDNYIYSNNKTVRKNIIAEYLGKKYIINNRKDLIEYGLKKTYISYELLEDFCNIHPNENRFELTYILENRDIKLSSKKIKYRINHLDEDWKVAEGKENSVKKIVGIYLEDFDILNPIEMFCVLEDLATEDNVIFDKKDFLKKYGCLYVRKIINTGILSEYNGMFFISPYAQTLIEKLKNSNANSCIYIKNQNRYSKETNIQEFCNKYNDIIIQILLQNSSIRKLINIIKKANKQSLNTMQGIAYYCYNKGLEKLFLSIFIGQRPTNGLKPLKEHTDVCFNCIHFNKCIGENVKNKNNSYVTEILLNFRDKYSKECLRFIDNENKIDILMQKPIYLKFLVSYKLVVTTKLLLKQFNIIEEDKILYKNHGEYCPQRDIWRVKNDILV